MEVYGIVQWGETVNLENVYFETAFTDYNAIKSTVNVMKQHPAHGYSRYVPVMVINGSAVNSDIQAFHKSAVQEFCHSSGTFKILDEPYFLTKSEYAAFSED
jgi:hypothetical protein